MSNNGKRGRPVGHKLSEETKRLISESKKGGKLSQDTKDKISRSLLLYFKKLYPLSLELMNSYSDYGDEVQEWLVANSKELDADLLEFPILTDREMYNKRRSELEYKANILSTSSFDNPEERLTLIEFITYIEQELDIVIPYLKSGEDLIIDYNNFSNLTLSKLRSFLIQHIKYPLSSDLFNSESDA